ncbi:MAG: hypothetical protein V7646_899 [Pseudonocardia sp.]
MADRGSWADPPDAGGAAPLAVPSSGSPSGGQPPPSGSSCRRRNVMGWLVGQDSILCAVAFAAGAGVTWLAFGRPTRRRRPAVWAGPTGMVASAAGPRDGANEHPTPVEPSPPPPPPPPPSPSPSPSPSPPATDPALAALGPGPDGIWRQPGAAAAAARALELLGVAPAVRPAGPADTGPDVSAPAGRDGTASTAAAPVGGDLVEEGLTRDSPAENRQRQGPAAEDHPHEDPRSGTPADPPPREREVSTGDIPAQGGPVDLPPQIPAQARPRENGSSPDGNGRT